MPSLSAFSGLVYPRRRRQGRLLAATVATVCAAVLVGCSSPGAESPAEGDEDEATRGDMTIALGVFLEGRDPHSFPGGENNQFHFNVFDGLVNIKTSGEVEPGLAETWDISEDGKTLTFHLRKDVTFHNGEEFAADDVVFSLDRSREDSEARPYASDLASVENVSEVDASTVEIQLSKADPTILNKLAYQAGMIVPKDYVTEVGDETFNAEPIGTGPYKFDSLEEGESVKIVANDDYWGGAPTLKSVTFLGIEEEATRIALLQAGDADVIADVEPNRFESLENEGFTLISNPGGERLYVQLRSDFEPFNDPDVVRAFNYAIDRDTIIENLYRGAATKLTSMLQPADESPLEPYPYDPAKAEELLQGAGFDDNFQFSAPRGWLVKGEAAAQVIAGNLREAGVDVDLKLMEFGKWIDDLVAGRAEEAEFTTVDNRLGDPAAEMGPIFSCDGPYSYWCDPEIDKRLEALSTATPDEFDAMLAEADEYILENPPAIFLWEIHHTYAMQEGVEWEPRSSSLIMYLDKATVPSS